MTAVKKCSLWFCDREYHSHGYCKKHYQNFRRHGTPIPRSKEDLRNVLNAFDALYQTLEELVGYVEPSFLPGDGPGAHARAKFYLDFYRKE